MVSRMKICSQVLDAHLLTRYKQERVLIIGGDGGGRRVGGRTQSGRRYRWGPWCVLLLLSVAVVGEELR